MLRPALQKVKLRSLYNQFIGVEVVVDKGENAFNILLWMPNLTKFYLVDINSMEAAKHKLKDYKEKTEFINLPSVKASKRFDDNSLNFVYIDAEHTYEAVTADMNAWYPKVTTGGMLCGHDYGSYLPEVVRAVDDYCKANNLNPTVEENDWMVIK